MCDVKNCSGCVECDLYHLKEGQMTEEMRKDAPLRWRIGYRILSRFPNHADRWYMTPVWWLM